MGSLCTPSGVHCRLFRWFLGKCFLLVASASLHDWFLHFLESVITLFSVKLKTSHTCKFLGVGSFIPEKWNGEAMYIVRSNCLHFTII